MMTSERKAMMTRGSKMAGLSLIELMISIALGLILSLALVQVTTSSKQTFVYEREMSVMQENARFAIETIAREISLASFTGCRQNVSTAVVVNGSGNPANWWYGPLGVDGYDYDVATASKPVAWPSDIDQTAPMDVSDLLIVRGAEAERIFEIANSSGTLIELPNGSNVTSEIETGDVVVASDQLCAKVSVFQVGTINTPGGAPETLDHGDAASPGNCDTLISTNDPFRDCSSGVSASGSFGAGGTLAKFHATAFYIHPSSLDDSVPALWRKRLLKNDSLQAEEILQGVENMQVTYGYDTDTPKDGKANYFFAARDESVIGAGNWDWSRVVSVRVALLLRSTLPAEVESETPDPFEGLALAADRFRRHQVVTTIQVKNHGL